jgi:tetratricopeptide (TPR) repeat protein
MKIAPCIGFALIILGQLRISQAIFSEEGNSPTAMKQGQGTVRLLYRAKTSLQHALTTEGLEAEAKIEGQLALAHVMLLLGELETAYQLAINAIEEARTHEQIWLIALSQRLLATVLAAKGQQEPAKTYFEQAMQFFQEIGMRLEWGRALRSYGMVLVQWTSIEDAKYQQGLSYLQQACQIFRECNAALDLRVVERILSERQPHATKRGQKSIKKES